MKTPKFQIHMNRELGNKKFYQERDYNDAMKKAGLQHYDPSSVKKREASPYKRSEWAERMLQDIKSRKGRKPGDRFIQELAKRGYTQEAANNARRLANGR